MSEWTLTPRALPPGRMEELRRMAAIASRPLRDALDYATLLERRLAEATSSIHVLSVENVAFHEAAEAVVEARSGDDQARAINGLRGVLAGFLGTRDLDAEDERDDAQSALAAAREENGRLKDEIRELLALAPCEDDDGCPEGETTSIAFRWQMRPLTEPRQYPLVRAALAQEEVRNVV